MEARKHQPIAGPCAWKGPDLQHSTEWLRPFATHELAEIDTALQAVKRRGLKVPDIVREDFPLPAFSRELAKIAAELDYAYSAQEYAEVPRLTAAQAEALALCNSLAEELALSMNFEPGDIQLLNNHLVYHGRTQFEDDAEEERKRLLLRLWLSVPGNRPLPRSEGYEAVLGNTEAGAIRGGVPCKDGWWRDVDQFRARRGQPAPVR